MRVVPRGVEPIGHWKTQVVLVQLDERRFEEIAFAELFGELVRLELKLATYTRHGERDELIVRREYELHNDDQADQHWPLGVEAERRVEHLTIHEHGEYQEIQQRVYLEYAVVNNKSLTLHFGAIEKNQVTHFTQNQILQIVVELPVA